MNDDEGVGVVNLNGVDVDSVGDYWHYVAELRKVLNRVGELAVFFTEGAKGFHPFRWDAGGEGLNEFP